MRALRWVAWRAADVTALVFEATPDDSKIETLAYTVYNRVARFAFWITPEDQTAS